MRMTKIKKNPPTVQKKNTTVKTQSISTVVFICMYFYNQVILLINQDEVFSYVLMIAATPIL